MSKILEAAIVCDDYKVEAFKKDLIAAGYKIKSTTNLSGKLVGHSDIRVPYTQDQFNALAKLIKQMNFKHSKTTKN